MKNRRGNDEDERSWRNKTSKKICIERERGEKRGRKGKRGSERSKKKSKRKKVKGTGRSESWRKERLRNRKKRGGRQ